MFVSGSGGTISFQFRAVTTTLGSLTATYGVKYQYELDAIVSATVSFVSDEFKNGEIITLPTGTFNGGKTDIYYLQESTLNKLITTDNTKAFTPTGDYQPATKKYVDDAVVNAGGTEYTAGENISISEDNVISAIIKTYSNRIISDIGATTYVQPDSDTVMLRIVDNVEAPTQSANLTTTDLTLSGVSVMNTLNEKVTNGNTTYPIKVYVQDTQPAAEAGYTVVWINTAV